MTVRQDYYDALENHFLSYGDLRGVNVADNGEPMVALSEHFSGSVVACDERMKAFTGEEIYVRKSLVALLEGVQHSLREVMPSCDLEVVYGYRHLDIQTTMFEEHKALISEKFSKLSDLELSEIIHRFIAVPEVSGHPTGGAVDVQIVDKSGRPLDMGTGIIEYSPDAYVFSPFISREAWQNRQILRACMMKQGFAPFEGEWWHFSYGDREWAYYYRKPSALYNQVRYTLVSR